MWLDNPRILGVPMVGKDQYGYISPAFLGTHLQLEFKLIQI